jgi:hypothetical protein
VNLDELHSERRKRWHQDGAAVRTLEAACEFIEDAGLCLMYPEPHGAPGPTFVGAWLGRDHSLPFPRAAFAHPEALEAETMKLRLLRERVAYEWPVGDNVLLVAASVFPFFYALAGDRGGRQQPPWAAGKTLSKLARDAWAEFERAKRPMSEGELRQRLGKGVSEAALRRALRELWQRLRVLRIDRTDERGEVWETLAASSRAALREAEQLSVASALSALISKYLDAVVAAEQQEIEAFFSPLVARSKVRDALHALLAAREVTAVQVGSHPMLQITPEKPAIAPRQARERTPAADPRQQPLRRRAPQARKPA